MNAAPIPPERNAPFTGWLLLALLVLLLIWANLSTLGELVQRWSSDPQSSHGFLIPLMTLFLLWQRRHLIPTALPGVWNWWGIALVAGSCALRLLANHFFFDWLEAATLVPTLMGLVVLVGGWPLLRWSWPALTYLLFMVPPPYQLETMLSGPLQQLATRCTTYTLQTLGYPAYAEGNVIVMEHAMVGVVEACNGLGMLMAFFAISTAVALVCQRPLLDRLVLVFSAIPIGVLINVLRITVTAIAHQTMGSERANPIFHDSAGWMMMPLAILLMLVELWLLDHLLPVKPVASPPHGTGNAVFGMH